MKKAANAIGTTILVLIILLGLFVFLSPRLLDFNLFTVLSGSMSPTIGVGEVVAVKSVPATAIKVGDIITYRPAPAEEPTMMVTHRVVEVVNGGTSFATKGDANDSPDQSLVPARNLVGKVIFHIPFFGYATKFVRTSLGFIFCLAIPAAVIIGGEIRKIMKVAKTRKETGPV